MPGLGQAIARPQQIPDLAPEKNSPCLSYASGPAITYPQMSKSPGLSPTSPFSHLTSLVLVALTLTLTTGCSRASSRDPGVTSASTPVAAAAGEPASTRIPAADRARIVTIETALVVDHIDDRVRELREASERAGGYVANASSSGADAGRGAHLEVKIPARELDRFRAALTGLGETSSWTERAEDVTEQRADLDARLRNARAQEKRILEILSTKASTLGEVLEAERELARLRESIERLDAESRSLESKIAYATVRISLTPRTTEAWRTPGQSLSRAASTGVRACAAALVYTGVAIATVGPSLLALGLLALGALFLARRLSRKPSVTVSG